MFSLNNFLTALRIIFECKSVLCVSCVAVTILNQFFHGPNVHSMTFIKIIDDEFERIYKCGDIQFVNKHTMIILGTNYV